MADDLSVAIDRLRTSTQRLNTITDAAAQTVRDVEGMLEEMQVGVSAWVRVVNEYDEGDRSITEIDLSYSPDSSGKYRVRVVRTPDYAQEPEQSSATNWAECSRAIKLQTFEKLPDLLIAIAKNVDERVTKAERVVSEVTARLPLPKKRKGGDK